MKFNIRALLLAISLVTFVFANSQSRNANYLLYIDQFHKIAEKQQNEHGIPASIVLAQGLLESGAGQSTLAKSSNNHFGIKCAEWAGDKVYHDDDAKGECFRKYNDVLDSYEDHAQFLKNRARYSFLFSLNPTDYEGWAYGLKKAGYATDPAYASKLISIIDTYELHQFDLGKGMNYGNKNDSKKGAQDKYGAMGTINAFESHKVSKVNKVKYVTARPGDSYALIADEFNMTEEKLRNYNEVTASEDLEPGIRVFISLKRRITAKDKQFYTVKPHDTMRGIAQELGIKTEYLYKFNSMDYTKGPKVGQVLKLNKK